MGTIGARLREERERVETSQAVFAAKLGQSRKSQIRYEAGDRTPDGDYLAAASAIGVDILYVLTGVRADPSWRVTAPQRIAVDPIRFRICLDLVAEEYRTAGIDLPQMAQGMEAVWIYNQLTTRITDPEDGDELEATIPLLRHLLRKRLAEAQA